MVVLWEIQISLYDHTVFSGRKLKNSGGSGTDLEKI